MRWFLSALVGLVLLVAIVGVGGRYWVMSPGAMLFFEARTSGLRLGPIGELHIEGLSGDILRDFQIARLTIEDEEGVWLEAANLSVQWNYWQLVRRKLDASSIDAEIVEVFRRPVLDRRERADSDLPLSFDIDSLTATIETHPEFSVEAGRFDLAADFEIQRRGGGSGAVRLDSLLRDGDGVTAEFSYGRNRPFLVDAHAVESEGGAIAGALGLGESRPFSLDAHVESGPEGGMADIQAQLGDETPLEVTGEWNAEGMAAEGRADLTVSDLLTEQVARFGPALQFTANGAPVEGPNLYQVEVEGTAENLQFTANGVIDAAEQATGPDGLALQASVGDLSRITPEPDIGPARFNGVVRGGIADLALSGDVEADGLSLAGFNASRVAGQVDVARDGGDWLVGADLTTAGGSGEGVLAGLLGRAPSASVQLTQFQDGRLLIRSMAVRGAGIDVQGRGSRTPVIGTLNFEGQGRVSNLEVVREGASGVVTGSWSARQGGNNQPWSFTADVTGEDFATGLAQLDRLLGPEPRLDAAASLDGDVWRVSRADLNGEAGDVSVTGVYGPGGALDLDGEWQATGPFQAGPVEIAGSIDGEGSISGTVSNPRADLTARIGGVDIGQLALENANLNLTFASGEDGQNGSIRLTADSAQGPARGRADFRFTETGVMLSGLDVNAGGATARGSLALNNGVPSEADLTVQVRPGAFIDAGQAQGEIQIADRPGGAIANLNIRGTNISLPGNDLVVRSATITGDGPVARMPYQLEADVRRDETPIQLNGSGVIGRNNDQWRVSFDGGGRFDSLRLTTIEPAVIQFGGPETRAAALLNVGGGRAAITMLRSSEMIDLDATLIDVDLSLVDPVLAGQFDARLSAEGSGNDLTGQVRAELVNMRSRDGPTESAIDGVFEADLTNQQVAMRLTASNETGLESRGNVTLPVETSAAPFRIAIARTRQMSGNFDIDGELRPIWDLFFGGSRTLGGRVIAEGDISGTLNEPRIVGDARLEDGDFEDFATGLKLRDVAITADLDRTGITVSEFDARDERRGTLQGDGRISLEGGQSTFTLNASQFLLIDNDIAQAQASGQATMTRASDGRMTLVGDLTIDRADVSPDPPTPSGVVELEVIEINIPPERADYFDPPRSRGPSIALDIDLNAPGRIFVRGRGLDVELELDAHVGGTTSAPVLSGEAGVVRGEYEFAGRRFEFNRDGVVYLSTDPEDIRLDLEATRNDPALTATIRIGGTAALPTIELSSVPSLPQDEILSQVLFGTSASQLSPFEAAQLASSLGALATGGGFDVIGGLREFAGLDRLTFGGGDASGLTVSGGKYLSDDVYLELTGGGREGGAAQVEWRVRSNLAIVSRVAGDGDTRLSVRWRKTFGNTEAQGED